ncbi:MAG: hypothetical protein GXY82_04640 [Methanospirillum sp.]|mgnify:CR=1 FL=1|nr:hypothetical protein [Methanospirillum sp.]
MRPGDEPSPPAITLHREAMEPAVRTLAAPSSAYLAATMKHNLDGAGKPGSDDGPIQHPHQPKRREAETGERAGG